MAKQFARTYVYAMTAVFATVLAVCARIGQIPNYLIYGTVALAIITAVLALTSQDYTHD